MPSRRGSIDVMTPQTDHVRPTGPRGSEALVRLPVCGVRPEVLTALQHLSATTGLAMAYLIRSVLEAHLSDLGLIAPADMTPTQRKEHKR